MRHRALVSLATGALLLLTACSSSGATTAPSAAASAAPPVEASTAASAPAAGAACSQSAGAGQVAVAIKDFAFPPADISAKVGQIVTFTNGDSAPHTATLDDGTCTTGNISSGASDGLLFSVAGTYPFHCKIHSQMKGTITVS